MPRFALFAITGVVEPPELPDPLLLEPLVPPDPLLLLEPLVPPDPLLLLEPLVPPDPLLLLEPLVLPDPLLLLEPLVLPDPLLLLDPLVPPDPLLLLDPPIIPDVVDSPLLSPLPPPHAVIANAMQATSNPLRTNDVFITKQFSSDPTPSRDRVVALSLGSVTRAHARHRALAAIDMPREA